MLSDSQVAEFGAQGFLRGGCVLSDSEVDELRAELQRVIDEHDRPDHKPVRIVNLSGKPDAPVWQIVNIWMASGAFLRLAHNRAIVEEVQQLTGARELRLWHDQIQYKPGQIGGVNMWHQDSPYWPNITPLYHHPLTWHGSHANKSGRPRRAIALHYMTDQTVYVEAGNHVMKPYVTVSDGEKLQGEFFPQVWPLGSL